MKQRSILWQAAGFAAATFGGTILHFLYDWTGGRILVSPFSGVNKSTWEHMKLLFWPLFLTALHWFSNGSSGNRKTIGASSWHRFCWGSLIPVLFYTYNGVFGQSPDWINIAIFYLTASLVFLFDRGAFKQNRHCKSPQLAFAAICLLGVLFVLFTFKPSQIPLFQDPLTGTYGILVRNDLQYPYIQGNITQTFLEVLSCKPLPKH